MPKSDAVDAAFTTWGPEVIKAAIRMRGMTLSKLATDAGLSESACRQSLTRGNSPAGDRAISEFLGVPLYQLWPDRYDENGEPICHVRDENSQTRDENHRQNVQVA